MARDDEAAETYPGWWRRNVEEFRDHDLPPYRPPRFVDGQLVVPLVEELERELDVSIRLRVVDPQEGNAWQMLVDGEPTGTVERQRHSEGYPLVRLSSEEFSALIRSAPNRD